jgi:hypothetical protein
MSDITIAASDDAFSEIFSAVQNSFTFSAADSASFGPFSASYDVALHLEDGTLTLNNDNTIEATAVDIVWDTLKVEVCFAIPGWCVPGFCIVPDPWNGCLVGFPGFCIGGQTICAPLDLSGIVSEVNHLKARPVAAYYVDPARLPAWSDLDAELNGHPNKWKVFIDPVLVSVDPIDIPATVANLLENIVRDAIEAIVPSWVPDWAIDLLFFIIGPILDFVKGILGIVDTVEDWLQDLLGDAFGLLTAIETAIADYFAAQHPIYEFEDPFPILQGGGLIPVKIPIRDLAATINSEEMIVTANVGA